MGESEEFDRDYCWYCIRTVKWSPVLFILLIACWSYYAYVIELCVYTVEKLWNKVLYIILYHILFGMFLWSYWQTVFTKNDAVPEKFKLPESEHDTLMHAENEDMQMQILEQFSRRLPNSNRTINGSVRFCEKCRIIKPDRAHHCSVCATCILKMDHHCPWVNNCIGFRNYKFFVLFLFYSLIYCLYGALTTVQYVISLWHTGKFHILFLFFAAVMFAISLVSLFSYHCYLVLHNRTTLEAFRAPIFATGPDKKAYDLGKMNNICEVFGLDIELWFLPISTTLGNGYIFPRLQRIDGSELLLASHNYTEEEERSPEWTP